MMRKMWRGALILQAIALCLVIISGVSSAGTDRNIRLKNDSGTKVQLYWIDPSSRSGSLMSDPYIHDGANFPLQSYVGHEFEVRELPSSKTGSCVSPDKVCHIATFKVTENDNQLLKILPNLELVLTDTATEAREEAENVIESCQRMARQSLAADPEAALASIESLVTCVEKGVARKLEVVNEEISFQAKIRKGIAQQLENYTCIDETIAESTPDVSTNIWDFKGVKRLVHVKHDRPSSQIHVVENFVDEEECQAMADEAAATLHHATVADGKGGSRLSENRKAMQAGIKVPWDKEADGHPIARLSRRVYDYANHVLGLGIEEHGQEDLMSIQYFGRGKNDTEPDRYTPHCDGDCTGLPHKTGTRMATMVMYCTLPSVGGATNFRNAGVHVKPVKGNAIFFSYIDPVSKLMDNGFTEHSGCPVYEGEKKIVTQWIRYGVDADNTWDSFNTLGIKHTEAENQ